MKSLKDTLLLAVGLFGAAIIAEHCLTGCAAAGPADKALTIAAYERELDRCRDNGKASGSYAVYEACADAVDRELCNTRGLRCRKDGGP